MATIILNGIEYTLASNLRVAYELQGQHNHKSYTQILSSVDEMTIEQQLDMIYIAFKVKNPDDAKTFTKEMFRKYILDSDEFNVTTIMTIISDIIAGILGQDLSENADAPSEPVEAKN